MTENIYAVTTLYKWFNLNKSFFIEHDVDIEFRDSGRGSASIRIETNQTISSAIAWDHASCLNIEIHDIKTEKFNCTHEGACESKELFDSILQEYLIELKNEIL